MHRDSGFVLVDHPQPHVALVTLNRPERMNSMAFDVMVPLKEVLAELTYDNSVRVVVLTGAGRGFSSGADHKSAGSVPHVAGLTRPTYGLRSMELLDDVILAMRKLHQPVIAAVNGAAIGGGLCLALAADIRVAAGDAYFRAAGINNGLTASELGLSYLLPRAIGASRAFEIMLTGRDVGAEEAERIGLVSRQVPAEDLLPTCYEIAERIAAFSRPVITGILRKDLGYDGVVMSDDLSAVAVQAIPPGQRAVRWVMAGGDLIIATSLGDTRAMADTLLSRARAKPAFRAKVGQAALRVLRAKARLGLLPCQ